MCLSKPAGKRKTRLICSNGFMIFLPAHISKSPRLNAKMKMMM